MKLGYLGPRGTFSEQAALIYSDRVNKKIEFKMFFSIIEVIDAVNSGVIDEGIVPFENSIEGTVTSTVDTLIFDAELFINSELILKVEQNLMAKHGTDKKDIKRIISHPQALAQCRKYIKELGISETIPVSSTAEAAHIVSDGDGSTAAIAPKIAAEVYDLEIIGCNISDDDTNATRFVSISKKENKPEACKKTSIAFTLDNDNSPGRLYRVLDILNIYEINMIKIESRPAKHRLGTYVFYIDLIAADDEDLRDAMKMLKRKVAFFKYLGSYSSID